MKPIENAEDFVRRGKTKATTDPQMDRRVLDDSFAAMDETAAGKSSAAQTILQSRAAKLAVAAVIIIAVGLLMSQSDPPGQEPPPIVKTAKSPAEMLSAMSLSMAYRRGGIEAVDDLSSKAFEMLGSQPAGVSIRGLLTESNGV
jgi:hypothetical protein